MLNLESSESDSEEEYDIDPSIYDSPMFINLPSSHGNTHGKDHSVESVNKKADDMFITARGRFIVPTSTLPHIKYSMDLVRVSPLALGSTTDSPNATAAFTSDYFYLKPKTFEMCSDNEKQSVGVCKEDNEEVMEPSSQDDMSTSSVPSLPFKVSLLCKSTAVAKEFFFF